VETLEKYTEKALADVFADDVQGYFTCERNEMAGTLAKQNDVQPDEIIAFTKDNLDILNKAFTISHCYHTMHGEFYI